MQIYATMDFVETRWLAAAILLIFVILIIVAIIKACAQKQLHKAQRALAAHNSVEAEHHLQSIFLQVSPHKINLIKSKVFFRQKRYQESQKCLNEALHKTDRSPKILQNIKDHAYTLAVDAKIARESGLTIDAPHKTWDDIADLCKNLINSASNNKAKNLQHFGQCKLYRAEELWALGSEDQAKAALDDAIRMIDAIQPHQREQLISGLASSRCHGVTALQNERTKQLLYDIDKETVLAPHEWLLLHDCLNWNGMVSAGYEARTLSIKAAYAAAEDPKKSGALIAAFRAATEASDSMLSARFLDKIKTSGHHLYPELLDYHRLNTREVETQFMPPLRHRDPADRAFEQYIRGKTIAIVGPAPDGQCCGNEIDGHDVVIRLNYTSKKRGLAEKEFGSRTDVSYYSNDMFNKLTRSGILPDTKDLQFYVCKSINYKFQHQDYKNLVARISKRNPHFYYKGPNAIPLVIYDLLMFRPKSIKVYKTNFYLSKQAYATGYSGRLFKDAKTFNPLHEVCSAHDLVSQVEFVRNMSKLGHITVDTTCSDILQLSNRVYAAQMEAIYGFSNQITSPT